MKTIICHPNSFEPEHHFYPRVLNAQLHPLVRYFLSLNNSQIAQRYCHLHPEANSLAVKEFLDKKLHLFHWGGADLIHSTNEEGNRSIVLIETNSSPSGQKSMPYFHEDEEKAGYLKLLRDAFFPALKNKRTSKGRLAVFYDKNHMEASGYANVMSEISGEDVLLVPVFDSDDSNIRCREDGIIEAKTSEEWVPIRAALRYVTQKPWNRIPPLTKTFIFNPLVICLAGGRNKLLAAKAYDIFNGGQEDQGLRIQTPETIWDVSLEEIPIWIERMGGVAVIKVPYSNAGQGVFTITSQLELDRFMEMEHNYDQFIVQALIGNVGWSSRSENGKLYHIGTIPDKKGKIYVTDLRFMVGNGPSGFFPVSIYARRAKDFLTDDAPERGKSWDMLGTNLSFKQEDGEWGTEKDRLMLMDSRDFNKLGISLDTLIESYIQTILSMCAIDNMGKSLINSKGKFKKKYFSRLNPDKTLIDEIYTL